MHKPITTPNARPAAVTAVAIFCGLTEAGQGTVFDSWSANDWGGGVELFDLCAQYGELSEEVLTELASASPPPFDFPGVYDYDVSEELGKFLRAKILAGVAFEEAEIQLELGRLMVEFFGQSKSFDPQVISRMLGYTKTE